MVQLEDTATKSLVNVIAKMAGMEILVKRVRKLTYQNNFNIGR